MARRYVKCSADADDAYQRALEKLITRSDDINGDRLAWFLTVVRNEALMINRGRARLADGFEQVTETLESDQPRPEDLLVSLETKAQCREAMRQLKPHQLRCLLLRAEGLGYEEIGRVTGFSYTKVNRYLSEGRAALRDRFVRIESGAECRRHSEALSMLSDGVLAGPRRTELQLHLRDCVGCRATLRAYRETPTRLAALFPLATAVASQSVQPEPGFWERIGDQVSGVANAIQERIAALGTSAVQGGELATAKKAALVVVVSASLVSGGAAVKSSLDSDGDREQTADAPALWMPTEVVAGPSEAIEAKPGAAGGNKDSQKPRDARDTDVVGERSVAPADTANDSQPTNEGDSAGPVDDIAAPVDQGLSQSGDPASDPSGEFAP